MKMHSCMRGQPASWTGRNNHALTFAVLLAALAVRSFHLATQSLWIDEGFTAYLVTLPTSQLLTGLITDRHPPLYFLLLQSWTMFCGVSEFALRYFSVVTSVLTVAVVYQLARRLAGQAIGLVSASLLTFAPLHIWYAQEARMYSLLTLLTVLHVGLAWKLLQRPGVSTWLAYLLVGTCMFYTAYVSIFVMAFETLIALAVAVASRRWRFLAKWATVQMAIGLIALPWLPILIRQMGRPLSWVGRPGLSTLGGTVLRVFFGAQEAYLEPTYLLAVCLCLLLFSLGGVVYLRQPGKPRVSAGFTAGWAILPILLIVGVSQIYPIYQNKQLLMLLPAMLILAAMSLQAQDRPRRLATTALLCSLWLFALHNQYFTPQKQDWRGVAAYVDEHGTSDDLIYINASGGMLALNYYLRGSYQEDAYPRVFTVENGGYVGETATASSVDALLSPLAHQHRRIWLIQVSPEFWDPNGYISDWLDTRCARMPVPAFYEVDVRLYLSLEESAPAL